VDCSARLSTLQIIFEVFLSTIGNRLQEERKRLRLNQTEFADFGGVQKRAQVNYEADERQPDAGYLAAIAAKGADVLWIITGQREYTPPPALSAEEQTLLAYFRQASSEVRRAALGALLGAAAPAPGRSATQVFHGNVRGEVIAGDKITKR
jgi:transcriptional regulator with XRE-family HTH domain